MLKDSKLRTTSFSHYDKKFFVDDFKEDQDLSSEGKILLKK